MPENTPSCEVCGREDRPLLESMVNRGTYRCDRHPDSDRDTLDMLATLVQAWNATPSALDTLILALKATGRRVCDHPENRCNCLAAERAARWNR